MKKIISLLLWSCACATFISAQSKNSGDHRKFEVFAGYTMDQDQREPNSRFTSIVGFTPAQIQSTFGTSLNNNSGRTRMNGFNVAATGYAENGFGITADFSAAFKTENQPVGARGSEVRRRKYNFLVGPAYKFRGESRIEPFVHALFGAARLDSEIRPDNTGVGVGGLSIDQLEDKYTAFAMGLGGGVDLRLNKAIKLRLIQVDYNPVFAKDRDLAVTNARLFGSTLTGATSVQGYRRDNVRLSFGIVF